ncbi:MAG TPA: alpha/beta fold hydrolase [Dehalococcoidia bacterium]|nr:alpha/beta fold hydrolase [Dehalococcoidia bacterium]
MPKAHANDIDIRYEVLGAENGGTPLVMTHGFASNADFWLPDIEPLAEKRRMIVYDVRGHGGSTVPEDVTSYSMPTFAADLASLLSALDVEKAHVVGISMGGMVTAQFAIDYAEMCESVSLIDATSGNGFDTGPGGEWERGMVKGMSMLAHMAQKYGLRETLIREWQYRQANDPRFDRSPYTLENDLERIAAMTLPGYLGAAHAMVTRPDLTGRVAQITAPTLVMIGAWDDFLPCAERDHGLIPGSRLVVREECGHGSRWRVETFRGELGEFVADVEAGRPVAGKRRV